MTDEKSWLKPIPPEYEYLLDGRTWEGNNFRAVKFDGGTGGLCIVKLHESTQHPGYWHISSTYLPEGYEEYTKRPIRKDGVWTFFLLGLGPIRTPDQFEWEAHKKKKRDELYIPDWYSAEQRRNAEKRWDTRAGKERP